MNNNIFTIDKDKCVKDGFCAAVCPTKILGFTKGVYPYESNDGLGFCLNCGQCVAVCQHDAFIHGTMPNSDFTGIRKNISISQEQAEQFFKSRRSIRTFRKESINKDILESILDITRYAPSGHNLQNVHWLAISDRVKIKLIAQETVNWMRSAIQAQEQSPQTKTFEAVVNAWDKGIDFICRDAPHVFCVYGEKDNILSLYSSIIALSHLELIAHSFGLGTCWAGFASNALKQCKPAKELIGLPDNCDIYGIMLLGMPRFLYNKIPPRQAAKVTWL
jgi:nitroreductase/Pyruvate/2-oxoacid:ferredoxin oxidoreductase delta subunit